MRLIKLTMEYDGTGFVGWQRQARGQSIQGLLESAIERIEGRAVAVIGAGRTDAGVHALAQVASFALEHPIPLPALVRALNATLPDAIRIQQAEIVGPAFHARHSARAKTYRYRILNGPVGSAFERHYVWHVPYPLDVDRMTLAISAVVGRHDFAAFQRAGSAVASSVRTIFGARVDLHAGPSESRGIGPSHGAAGEHRFITVEIRGDGFLRHMVRGIVGTLAEIGAGRREPASLAALVQTPARERAGPTAPPHGLYLIGIEYESMT